MNKTIVDLQGSDIQPEKSHEIGLSSQGGGQHFNRAQVLRLSHRYQEAFDLYIENLKMEGCVQEVYLSGLNAARLLLNHDVDCSADFKTPVDQALDLLNEAIKICPDRLEARVDLAKVLRLQRQYRSAAILLRNSIDLPIPDGLLIESWYWEYGAEIEYAVCAYHAGWSTEALEVCYSLLNNEHLSDETKRAVNCTARLCLNAIKQRA